jgi:DNA-directed RNA polymerase subunit K/omega
MQETLTIYERTKVVGLRAEQLARGAPTFLSADQIPSSTSPFDACKIAAMELDAGVLPYVVSRNMPNGGIELLRLSQTPKDKSD